MASSHASPLSVPPTPLTPSLSAVGPAPRAQASGTGGTRLSRATPNPPGDAVVFRGFADATALQNNLGRHTNPKVATLRIELREALCKPGGTPVRQLETILQALVDENKAYRREMRPLKSHLYMGFGGVSPRERAATAAQAKQLRQAAYAVWAQLKNPECRQMLDWIAADWAVYEKSLHIPGTRTAMYRSQGSRSVAVDPSKLATTTLSYPTVTTTTTTNATMVSATTSITATTGIGWSVHAVKSHAHWDAVTGAAELMHRAELRDDLIKALNDGDTDAVTEWLQQVPPDVTVLSKYFPPALVINSHALALETATRYDRDTATARSYSLRAFISGAHSRSLTVDRVAADQQDVSEAELDQLCAPPVRQLCLVLRNVSEQEIEHYAHDLAMLVLAALQVPTLEADLTRQPYASLKVVLLKCTLLETPVDRGALEQLRTHVRKAHEQQVKDTEVLRRLLLTTPVSEAAVATFALSEYAREMTAGPSDYVSAGVMSMAHINTLGRNIEHVYQHCLEKNKLGKLEMAALRWVRDHIHHTRNTAHR